jgi:hypothetical protein
MIAVLRTRCGCTRTMEIDGPHPYYHLELKPDMPKGKDWWHPDKATDFADFSHTEPLPNRLFKRVDIAHIDGEEVGLYLEVMR